jgi:hypothetical protein
MRTSSRLLFPSALAFIFACSSADSGPTAPPMEARASADGGAGRVTVTTQNLYPGANLDLVIAALVSPDPSDDLPALGFALQTFQETDYPLRAAAIADRVARERPHAIGLQEVFTFDLDVNFGTPVQIFLPFLPVLQNELALRGLHYIVAAENLNYTLSPFPGITLSDEEVLLVDADRVTVESGSGHTFTANLPPFGSLQIKRGWVMATVWVDGRHISLASAHPESGYSPGLDLLRAAQIGELVASLPAGLPTILMGDLNDLPGTPMYEVIAGAGFSDLWREMRPGVTGFTCCHTDNLSEQVPAFDQRIDYVFGRGFGSPPIGDLGQIFIVGDRPSDRFAGPVHPLWPSDHAGLVATLLSPPGRAR